MADGSNYAHPEVLVETDWVAQHLDHGGFKLIEIDVDTEAYAQGHIAGAIGFNWQTELEDTLRRDVPDKGQWESLLSKAGISNDDTLVLLRRQQQLVRDLRLLAVPDLWPRPEQAETGQWRPEKSGWPRAAR